MLCTERATRGSARGLRALPRLLSDWTKTVVRVGEELELDGDRQRRHRAGCRRSTASWTRSCTGCTPAGTTCRCPTACASSPRATWDQLNLLAEPGGDTPRGPRPARRASPGLRRPLRRGRGRRPVERRSRRSGVPPRPGRRPGRGGRRGVRRPRRPARKSLPQDPPGRRGASSGACERRGRGCLSHGEGYRTAPQPRGPPRLRRLVAQRLPRARRRASPPCCGSRTRRAACPGCCRRCSRPSQHVVVIDNQSDDGTPDVAREVPSADRRRGRG